jgi:glucose/mannose transport system substrate-binding protein
MKYRDRLIAALTSLLTMSASAMAKDPCQIWHYWGTGAEHDAIKAVIDIYNKEYPDAPVTDRYVPGSALEMRRALQTALLGGTAPAAYQSGLGYELKTFADAGELRPITDAWNAVDGDKVFPEGLQRVMKVDGKPYGMPLNMHLISNIFYNKEIFEKANVTPPQSLEELRSVCEKIEATGVGCLANASGPIWSLYNFFVPLIATVGKDGYFKLASGDMAFDSPEFRKALRLYGDTYVKHYEKNWSGKTWPQGADDVVAGRAAMYQMGDWVSAYFKDVKWTPGKEYDFFPAPGIGPAVIIQVDAIAAPDGACNATADNFMKVAGNPDGQAAFNVHKGSLAANLKTPATFYDSNGSKEYANMQAAAKDNAVLPNLFFLLPTDLGSELGVQLERFAADPSDATLETVVSKLEAKRKEEKAQKTFVTW